MRLAIVSFALQVCFAVCRNWLQEEREREENVELATEPLLLQMDLRASQVQDDDDDER